jgi:hypothetical protein
VRGYGIKAAKNRADKMTLILPAHFFSRLIFIFIVGVTFALLRTADGFFLVLPPLFCSGYEPPAFTDFAEYFTANDFLPETA